MKKAIIGILVCFLGLFGYVFYKSANPDPITIDLTQNVTVKFKGKDTLGTAEIENNFEINTDKSYINKFVNGVEYTISKDSFLSNGDKIVLKATYDKSFANSKNIIVKNAKKTIKVKGLKKYYDTYKGVTVTTDMTKKEKEAAYKAYLKEQEQESSSDSLSPSTGADSDDADLYQGDLSVKTNKTSKTFSKYSEAYNYGKESSQQYKVKAFQEDGETKYRCEFVDGDNPSSSVNEEDASQTAEATEIEENE